MAVWAGWGWAGSWRPSFQNPLAPSSVHRASYTRGDPRPEQGWTGEAVSWGPRGLSTAHPQVPIQLVGQKGRHGTAAPASFRVGRTVGQVEKEGPSPGPHDVLSHVVSHGPQRLGPCPPLLAPHGPGTSTQRPGGGTQFGGAASQFCPAPNPDTPISGPWGKCFQTLWMKPVEEGWEQAEGSSRGRFQQSPTLDRKDAWAAGGTAQSPGPSRLPGLQGLCLTQKLQ